MHDIYINRVLGLPIKMSVSELGAPVFVGKSSSLDDYNGLFASVVGSVNDWPASKFSGLLGLN